MYVHQTAAGNVVAGLRAKDAWAIKKFGRGYTVQFVWNVEHTTQHTAHYTHNARFLSMITLAWASMLVYVLKYSANVPTREETYHGE